MSAVTEHWVHPNWFQVHMGGFPAQLGVLSLEQKVEFFDLNRSLFLMESSMAVEFVNAFFAEPELNASQEGIEATLYSLRRLLEASPINASVLQCAAGVLNSPELERLAERVRSLAVPEHLTRLFDKGCPRDRERHELLKLLDETPYHLGAAERLLNMGTHTGETPDDWLPRFICPPPLTTIWTRALFLHYARCGFSAKALELWPEVRKASPGAYCLTMAGCAFMQEGEAERGASLLRAALEDDPSLVPVRMRLEEYEHPLRPSNSLAEERSVVICIFSWNRGEDLEQTLRSIAASRLGKAKVRLLLNGCTDDSAARVERTREAFGQTDFAMVSLPVNVGVAAARNWLLTLPETQQADYVVFADDDIVVQEDWLASMLTVAEADPDIGVVGAKAVSTPVAPGRSKLQYMYRTLGIDLPGLFTLTLSVPDAHLFDNGLYSFTRECLTVMGCLILLRGDILRKVGGFDIQFNPSQVEDTDHDLAVVLGGYKVVYCGNVTVVHNRNSSSSRPHHPASIWLNHLKMGCKRLADVPRLRDISRQLVDASSGGGHG